MQVGRIVTGGLENCQGRSPRQESQTLTYPLVNQHLPLLIDQGCWGTPMHTPHSWPLGPISSDPSAGVTSTQVSVLSRQQLQTGVGRWQLPSRSLLGTRTGWEPMPILWGGNRCHYFGAQDRDSGGQGFRTKPRSSCSRHRGSRSVTQNPENPERTPQPTAPPPRPHTTLPPVTYGKALDPAPCPPKVYLLFLYKLVYLISHPRAAGKGQGVNSGRCLTGLKKW